MCASAAPQWWILALLEVGQSKLHEGIDHSSEKDIKAL